MDIFKKFNIDNRQVFSITCYNGANIIKMVHILNDSDEDNWSPEEVMATNNESHLYGKKDDFTSSNIFNLYTYNNLLFYILVL